MCFFEKGLDTRLTLLCLVTKLQSENTFHAKFDGKNCVQWRDTCQWMAEKDQICKAWKKWCSFWLQRAKILGKIEVFIVFTLHPTHWKAAERLKVSTLLHLLFKFPHNLAFFPHNQHIFPHNIPENFRIIFNFFPHPIRCPVYGIQLQNVFSLSVCNDYFYDLHIFLF